MHGGSKVKMPIQTTISGGAKLTGIKTGVTFRNGLKKRLVNGRMVKVFKEDDIPVVKVENITGREDGHYRDVQPVKATEAFFLYPLSDKSFNKLSSVDGLQEK